MDLEISSQMRPAQLPPRQGQVRIGPPAVGGDDRPCVLEQALGVILMATRGDAKERVAIGERAPQRAALTGGAPAGLIHVQRPCAADALQQIRMRLLQCLASAGQDRIDGARRDPCTEELIRQLDHVAAGDAVAHRQRHERRPQAGTKGTARHLAWQLGACPSATLRAAHTLAAMLDHSDRDRRQLLDLVRAGSPTAWRPSSEKTWPQPQHSGQCSITSSTAQAGSRSRPRPSWPGCPPRLRPERSLLRLGVLPGGSELGGSEELRELLASWRSSFSTRASSCWMRRSIANSTSTTTSRPAS